MAFIEISELPETLNIDSSSVFPLVYQGVTKKVTLATLINVLAYFNSANYNKTTGVLTIGQSNNASVTLNTRLQESIKNISIADGVITITKQDDSESTITISVPDGTITKQKLDQLLQDEINGKYEKPNTGIPSTDLATGVQTSLGKADSALQTTDIVSEVSSSSTNLKTVGAKLFYDTVGDLETILQELDVGGGVQ